MLLRPLLLCASFVLCGAARAEAADVAAAAAGPVPFDWSGPRAGAYGGFGSLPGDGVFAGVTAGYDWRAGAVVFGLDAGLSAGDMDARRHGGRYAIDAAAEIRARIGYAFDRFMAYGTVGATFAATDYARAGRTDRALQAGWLLGAGVEIHLFDQVAATVEYVYVDLDRKTFDAGGEVGVNPAGGQVRLGVNYRF